MKSCLVRDQFKSILYQHMIRSYAGARALGNESATHRDTYMEKATGRGGYLGRVIKWLNENMANHLLVGYEGVTEPVRAILAQTRSSASRTVPELLQVVTTHLLAPQFGEAYGQYPAFKRLSQPVTENARATNATEAIRFLAGHGPHPVSLSRSRWAGPAGQSRQRAPLSIPLRHPLFTTVAKQTRRPGNEPDGTAGSGQYEHWR